jgi:uncharacterized protein (UPF0332 family)
VTGESVSSKKPLTAEGVQRAMAALYATWVDPEVRRRMAAGQLPTPFRLSAWQLILDAETKVSEVRLNEEVRAAVRWRRPREIARDEIKIGEVGETMLEILLTDQDPDAAHITALATSDGGWHMSSDFRPNAHQAAHRAAAAREFLAVAEFALHSGNLRPFVETLYGATELMAEAYLLTVPGTAKRSKTHGARSRPFHLAGRDGRVHRHFTMLLKRLQELRGPARYLDRDLDLTPESAERLLSIAEVMYRTLDDVIPKRHASRR